MKCAWDAYLSLLPQWMRKDVDKQGRDTLLELRMRTGQFPQLKYKDRTGFLSRIISNDDLLYTINAASRYSPWNAGTMRLGYIAAQGGHRVGICGECVVTEEGGIKTISAPSSLCVRVARDITGIADKISSRSGSILIIGSPGTGKTTLLRDLIRMRSNMGDSVGVVDEKEEIFPRAQKELCFPAGQNTDILWGCGKKAGIDALLRCMTPDVIALDEVSMQEDCEHLVAAGWCGVKWIATVHASSVQDLYRRAIYRPLAQCGLFDLAVVLHKDKSFHMEELQVCS